MDELHGATVPGLRLVCHLKNSNLGGICTSLRKSKTKRPQFGREERGSSAGAGLKTRQTFGSVPRQELKGVNETFAARDIDTIALWLEEEVIGVTGDFEIGSRFACLRIEHNQARRSAAADEQPTTGFIQRHGEVGLKFFHWLTCHSRGLVAIDNSDLFGVRQVDEDAFSSALQLERFRVSGEFDGGKSAPIHRIDYRQRTV